MESFGGRSPPGPPLPSGNACRYPAMRQPASGPHSNFLVDEPQGVRLVEIETLGIDAGARHRVEEIAPACIGHRADAVRLGVAAVDDAVLFDLGDAVSEQRVGHLRVVALDQLVRRGGVAVEIAVPAL